MIKFEEKLAMNENENTGPTERTGYGLGITRIFARIISFMLFTVLLSIMYFFSKNF